MTEALQSEIQAIKRDAVARFKKDHDDGDIAIYDVVSKMSDIIERVTDEQA